MEILKIRELNFSKLSIRLRASTNVVNVCAGLAASYLVYKSIKIYLRRRKYAHIPGPPTTGLLGFYFGNMAEHISNLNEGYIFNDLLNKWHEKYGRVFKFQMMDKIFVCTSDKDAIKEVLIVKDYPKLKEFSIDLVGFPLGERFLGHGLVTDMNYERWKSRRAFFNPGFHRHVLLTFVDHFNTIVNSLLDKLRQIADGRTSIQMGNEINRATLDAIALIAFGMHTDSINDQNSLLNSYLTKVLHTVNKLFEDPFYTLKPNKFGQIIRSRKMIRYMRKLGREKLVERINAHKNNEHVPNDILSAILSSYKGEILNLEEMTDDFMTFFVAGQETTANTLAFCILELGKNAKLVEKAREEIDRVLGERTNVTYQDVNELKYCTAIFKESLRLYPPVTALCRVNEHKININGYDIPEKTPIFVSTYMNARDETYFPNALEFRPERFLKNGTEYIERSIENYVYHPFSLGPRNCIGQNFAQLEGIILIARFLQTFDFKLDPNQSFRLIANLTIKPEDGAKCFLTLRS